MQSLKTKFILSVVVFFFACGKKPEKLPYLYEKEVISPGDTLYYTIPNWEFINQDEKEITSTDYEGKIWVADFFFTHCPTICPFITSNLKKVQGAMAEIPVYYVSFTVDPKNDTPDRFRKYIDKNGIDTRNWNFLTGEKADLYYLGEYGFKQLVQEKANEPGGFLHSPYLSLIDKEGHVRGIYDGTDNKEIDKLVNDIKTLVKEYE
jgi:protein SCO1